jgi:hypothetical protein
VQQLEGRKETLAKYPNTDRFPCPVCGGTEYMLSTINLNAPEPDEYRGIFSEYSEPVPQRKKSILERVLSFIRGDEK